MPRRLDKVGCRACGLIRHRVPLASAEVAAIYNENYDLPGQASLADDARGEAYARVVAGALGGMPDLGRLLEIGCGSGAAARFLSQMLPAHEIRGVDPALLDEFLGTVGKVTLARGRLEDQTGPAWSDFDAVVSINTIEHTPDPSGFLTAIAARLRPNGKAVVICPVATPANCELLFFDHLWTLSRAAFHAFAAAAGLRVAKTLVLDKDLTCFQVFVLEKGDGAQEPAAAANPDDAARYLAAWQELDDFWCARLDALGGRVQIFGAGQMAAVIRAYAPRTWARAERLVVDNPTDAWDLGRIERYVAEDHAHGYRTIVAVNPLVKAVIAERIRRDGGEPLVMPDTIRF
jgi:SAM-dependent methyltransferase